MIPTRRRTLALPALCLLLAAGPALAGAPWTQEARDGGPAAVARQGGLELRVACDDGRLAMTYAIPKEALAPDLRGLPKVYLVLDYDGGGTGLYWWYETRLTDGGEVWLTRPIASAVLDNVRMLAEARTDIRVGLSATQPEIGFTLRNEAWMAAKGSSAAVRPALKACGISLK